jgi:AGCS family alanine or glycine:cation symporter
LLFLFAVVSIISAGVLLPGVQANSVADGIQNAFEDNVEIWNSGIFNIWCCVFGGVKESPNSGNLSFHNGHYLYYNCIGDHVIISINFLELSLFLKVLLTWKLVWSRFGLAVQWGVKEDLF